MLSFNSLSLSPPSPPPSPLSSFFFLAPCYQHRWIRAGLMVFRLCLRVSSVQELRRLLNDTIRLSYTVLVCLWAPFSNFQALATLVSSCRPLSRFWLKQLFESLLYDCLLLLHFIWNVLVCKQGAGSTVFMQWQDITNQYILGNWVQFFSNTSHPCIQHSLGYSTFWSGSHGCGQHGIVIVVTCVGVASNLILCYPNILKFSLIRTHPKDADVFDYPSSTVT